MTTILMDTLRTLQEEKDKEAGVYFDGIHFDLHPQLIAQQILGKRYLIEGYELWLGADETNKYKINLVEQGCQSAKS